MDRALMERLREEIRYEFGREGPPEGFPKFPDIPGGRYTDPRFFELEQKYVWSRSWLLAGRVDDVPTPGDYMLWTDSNVPVLVVHGVDGTIRAFFNSCQHRGAPVVRESRGNNRALRCQYHSWTYDTTGKLVSVPDERDFVDLDLESRCLPQLRCEIFGGWIFVNQDPDALPLLEWLGPVATQWEGLQGDTLRTIHKKTVTIPCNWKVTVEAFQEVYHFKHIHSRGGDSGLDNRGATMGLFPNGHSRMITPLSEPAAKARGMKDCYDWQMFRSPYFAEIETVDEMTRSTSTAYSVFPNLITPLAADGFPFLIAWPIDIGTTRFDVIHYAPDWGDEESPVNSKSWRRRLEGFDVVMEEDCRNMAPMQRSLDSPGLRGIPINYQERRIWHLNEQIDRMIGIERVPEELRVPQLLEPYLER